MIIYDEDHERFINGISILLSKQELLELRDKINCLVDSPKGELEHFHVANKSYQKEITVSMYTYENISQYSPVFREEISRNLLEDAET